MKQPKKIIIGLTGLKGSGKGTVAKILQEKYGARLFRFSDSLRDILTRLGLEVNRESLVHLSDTLRAAYGEGILKSALAKDVEKTGDNLVVLDGIRRVEELDGLEQLGDFHLVAVEAPLDVRYARSANRGENAGENHMTRKEFERTENASTEVTIPPVMARATHHINNGGTYEKLLEQIEKLVKEVQG